MAVLVILRYVCVLQLHLKKIKIALIDAINVYKKQIIQKN